MINPVSIVKKDVDEIKTPSNRILVTLLIVAAATLFSLYVKSTNTRYNDLAETKLRMKHTIDSLRHVITARDDSDNVRLRRKLEWYEGLQGKLEEKLNKIK